MMMRFLDDIANTWYPIGFGKLVESPSNLVRGSVMLVMIAFSAYYWARWWANFVHSHGFHLVRCQSQGGGTRPCPIHGTVKLKRVHSCHLPQKGIPTGLHVPSSPQTRREGPRSSKPLSQAYVAMTPSFNSGPEKVSAECAGASNWH